MRIRVFFLMLLGLTLTSCDSIFPTKKDEPLVKVGNQTLYMSDVESMFPKNTWSSKDTNNLLKRHIESWAKQQLLLQLAEDNLSTEIQKYISKQVEDYRSSLLVYRYEQMYVDQRLDTVISEKEYEDFYNAHKQTMVLSNPIVKVLFIKLKKNSPYLDKIKKLYTST
ncbi:MAG: peptidyl-prolyl cis-trans isomerase, partial [Prevotellaceae bacterium]|nr:peptidyl-prolyl cis-trans isomerase [Prevotellaceae bacterium]